MAALFRSRTRWLILTVSVIVVLAISAGRPSAAPTADAGARALGGVESDGCGVIDTDTRWTAAASPYVVTCSTQVAAGVILTVDPGVTVKFNATQLEIHGGPAAWLALSGGSGQRSVVAGNSGLGNGVSNISGTLGAMGTQAAPISFTSFWDDQIGGDTDGTPAPAVPGEWMAFILSPGATASLDRAVLRYGGAHRTNLSVVDASLRLTNSELSYSADRGLGIQMATKSRAGTWTIGRIPLRRITDGWGVGQRCVL